MKNNETIHAISELIRLHDDVLARVFALQSVLLDLDLASASEVQQRSEEFRKRFATDLEARLAEFRKRADAGSEIQRRQAILAEYDGPEQ